MKYYARKQDGVSRAHKHSLHRTIWFMIESSAGVPERFKEPLDYPLAHTGGALTEDFMRDAPSQDTLFSLQVSSALSGRTEALHSEMKQRNT